MRAKRSALPGGVIAGDFAELVEDDCANEDTPILMGHSIDDRMVAPALGKSSYDKLNSIGFDVSWEIYP